MHAPGIAFICTSYRTACMRTCRRAWGERGGRWVRAHTLARVYHKPIAPSPTSTCSARPVGVWRSLSRRRRLTVNLRSTSAEPRSDASDSVRMRMFQLHCARVLQRFCHPQRPAPILLRRGVLPSCDGRTSNGRLGEEGASHQQQAPSRRS
jgi:hypothetical protein